MKTVAVFQYSWPVTIHTINLVNVLAERSYKVHLFLYSCSTAYFESDSISSEVTVHTVALQQYSLWKRITDRLSNSLFGKTLFRKTVNQDAINYALGQLIMDEGNVTFIGIEKKGLAWAGLISERMAGKLFYYSLELYETNPGWFEKYDFLESRKQEIRFHARTQCTIIQDCLRASALFKYNNFPPSRIIQLPVSVRGSVMPAKPRTLSDRVLILYFGLIEERRNIKGLLDSFVKFSIQTNLRLHGPAPHRDFLNYLEMNYSKKNIEISTTMLGQAEIDSLIQAADIGVCFYANSTINDRLTAFSSEKIARYLKYGIPIISFYNESYLMLFSSIECGIMISSYDELEDAVSRIRSNYPYFTKNAITAFDKYFNFDTNIGVLLGALNQ